jgi:hypothetical protein
MSDINEDKFEAPAGPYRDQDGHNVVDAQGNPVICPCLWGADRLTEKLNEAFRLGYRAALMEKA